MTMKPANLKEETSTQFNTNPDLTFCELDNMDCPFCGNRGYIVHYHDDGTKSAGYCTCMKRRRSNRSLKKAGLDGLASRYTFAGYKTETQQHERILDKAKEFTARDEGFFIITGCPGSGKTHICTAICTELCGKGSELKYFLWRKHAAEIKSLITDAAAYKSALEKCRDVDVLYIDDFFKGTVSAADIDLAFSIINDRYNSTGKHTIISTEKSVSELLAIDEAIGSRIVERAKGFILQAPKKNYRLEGAA